MDPLSVLREYAMGGKLDQVAITDTDVVFGDAFTFPRGTKTAYKSNKGQGEYYQLETLVFYMQNVNVPVVNYITNARSSGMKNVQFLDRKVRSVLAAWVGDHTVHCVANNILLHRTSPPTCLVKATPATTLSLQMTRCLLQRLNQLPSGHALTTRVGGVCLGCCVFVL